MQRYSLLFVMGRRNRGVGTGSPFMNTTTLLPFTSNASNLSHTHGMSSSNDSSHLTLVSGLWSLLSVLMPQTHASVPPEKRAELGISDNLIRLSIGIEHVDDLVEDLAQALEQVTVQSQTEA